MSFYPCMSHSHTETLHSSVVMIATDRLHLHTAARAPRQTVHANNNGGLSGS